MLLKQTNKHFLGSSRPLFPLTWVETSNLQGSAGFDQGDTQCCALLAAKAGSPKTMTLIALQQGTGVTFPFVCHVKGWCVFSLVQLISLGPAAAISDRAGVTPDCCGSAGAETSGAAAAAEGVSTAKPWGCCLWGSALAQGVLGSEHICPTMPPLGRELSVCLQMRLKSTAKLLQ